MVSGPSIRIGSGAVTHDNHECLEAVSADTYESFTIGYNSFKIKGFLKLPCT